MAIRLYQAMCTDDSFVSMFCTSVDSDTLTNGCVVANLGCSNFTFKLQILRFARNYSPWKDPAVLSDPSSVHNGHIGPYPRPLANYHILVYSAKRLYHHIIGNF